jgi:hypothetical protein
MRHRLLISINKGAGKPEPLARSLEHNSRKHDGEPRSLRHPNYGPAGAAATHVATVMRTRRPYGT